MKTSAPPLLGALLLCLAPASSQAGDSPLVDCSEARFKSPTSARSLWSWSKPNFEAAKRAEGSGVYPERACGELLRQRGTAHCKELDNPQYRADLAAAQTLCASLKPAAAAAAPAAAPPAPVAATSPAKPGKPLVNCSLKRFKSGSSAKSLMGWSNRGFQAIEQAQGSGIYPEGACKEVISKRGDAHCQKPKDAEIAKALQAALTLCDRLKNPAPAKGKTAVDCKDQRFQRRKPVPTMVKWSLSMSARLDEMEGFRAKAMCAEALAFAGSAHCMLPNEDAPRDALESVNQACGADAARRAAEAKAAKAATAKAIADQKANRKIVKYPRATFRGSAKSLSKQMKAAMQASGIAKSTSEMLDLRPMGAWREGRYRVTKMPYRTITGTVLWHDKDEDGVCRFTTYKFVQDKGSKGWGKLRFKAFCLGCPEGWTKCK